MALLGALSGLLLGVIVSGGILSERLTLGALPWGSLAAGLATVSAIIVARVALRRRQILWLEAGLEGGTEPLLVWQLRPVVVLFAQAIGAGIGIVIIHATLRFGPFPAPGWLSEAPAQFVNDGVCTFGLLALAWAWARNLDVIPLVLILALLASYLASASHWHVDQPPAAYQMTVQQYVVVQCLGSAFALAFVRNTNTRARERMDA